MNRSRLALGATVFGLSAALGGCAITSTSGAGDSPSVSLSPLPATAAANPDAIGTVVALPQGIDSVLIEFEPDAGFEYFEGTVFDVTTDAFPRAADGDGLAPLELRPGDRIHVWVGVCRESFPVQCDVERVEIAP